MPQHTALFDAKVRDYLKVPPVVVRDDATLGEAWAAARVAREPIPIVRTDGSLFAMIAANDVLDWLARGLADNEPIVRLAAKLGATLMPDQCAFDALVALRSERLASMPVVAEGGRFVGSVALVDLLSSIASPVADLADVAASTEKDALRQMREASMQVASRMLHGGVPSHRILATLSALDVEAHRQVLSRALADLETDGWGTPPVAYALIVMGSVGRGEAFLDPDQDHALILADHPDEDRLSVESFFVALAERLVDGLEAAGFTRCKGNVMSTSPVWRKSVSEWREQLHLWTRRRQPMHLLDSCVLLDMRHVAGDIGLSSAVRDDMLSKMSGSREFVQALYRIGEDHDVALNWLGRVRAKSEPDQPGDERSVNLKLSGTLPLVEGARLLSLLSKIDANTTIDRLKRSSDRGAMNAGDATELTEAFSMIATLLLRRQLEQWQRRQPLTDSIDLVGLDNREIAKLRTALRAVSRFRSVLPELLSL